MLLPMAVVSLPISALAPKPAKNESNRQTFSNATESTPKTWFAKIPCYGILS